MKLNVIDFLDVYRRKGEIIKFGKCEWEWWWNSLRYALITDLRFSLLILTTYSRSHEFYSRIINKRCSSPPLIHCSSCRLWRPTDVFENSILIGGRWNCIIQGGLVIRWFKNFEFIYFVTNFAWFGIVWTIMLILYLKNITSWLLIDLWVEMIIEICHRFVLVITFLNHLNLPGILW